MTASYDKVYVDGSRVKLQESHHDQRDSFAKVPGCHSQRSEGTVEAQTRPEGSRNRKGRRGSPDSHQTVEGFEGVDARCIPNGSQGRRQPALKLIDSSGWIEYLAGGPKADQYAGYVSRTPPDEILTPTLVVFEVYRKVKKDKGEEKALEAYAHLENTKIVALDPYLCLAAADLSLKTGLGTVDSVIYATAAQYEAQLITNDHHFKELPRVTLI